MEISTKETSEKLRKDALKKLKPFIEELARQGVSQDKIVAIVKKHVNGKIESYYDRLKALEPISAVFDRALAKKADSKAECVLYGMLYERGIEFHFQYPIGRYRVDYLVGDNLILELDGPGHNNRRDEVRDQYLGTMGYRVLRVSLPTIALDSEAVIREIETITGKGVKT